jgi:hypothetical protein
VHASCVRQRTSADYQVYARLRQDIEPEQRWLEIQNDPEQALRRLYRRGNYWAARDSFRLVSGLSEAYRRYFYTESFKRHAVKASQRSDAVRKLCEALDTLLDQSLWEMSGVEPPDLPGERASRRWSTLRDALSQPVISSRRSVIARLDETARERALAYELWRLFKRITKRNCSAAIYYYLQMDGVQNPPAAKEKVEEWIKAWKDN